MRLTKDSGFTLIELLIVVALVGILAGLSAHHVLRARAAANEASAIGTVRSVASGQASYAVTCGGGFYADTLVALVDGRFVSSDVNLSPKSGYLFELIGGEAGSPDCSAGTTAVTYRMTAVPNTTSSGSRGFATNQGGAVWQDSTGAAPEEPFERSGTVTPIQ